MEINFKQWVEAMVKPMKPETDPNVLIAQKKASQAVQLAIKGNKNPVKAAQNAVAQSNVPVNKLGKVMPVGPDDDETTL